MTLIPVLILMPLISAVLIKVTRNEKARSLIIYISVALILACMAAIIALWMLDDGNIWRLYTRTELLDHGMQIIEVLLMLFIIFSSSASILSAISCAFATNPSITP